MKKVLLMLFAVTAFVSVNAQNGLPTNATPGKCYQKCFIPDQWKTETERVLVKAASTRNVAVPAKFETKTERIMSKEASTRLTVIPAKYETRTERILVKEASKRITPVAAKYETRTERILVEPATTKWVKQKDAMCRSKNSDDCMVWCLVEVAPQYKTVTKRVVGTPATTRETAIPAQYKTVTKRVLVSAAKTVETAVPAQYKTVTKRMQVSPASATSVAIPAQYKNITKRVLVKQGGFSDYREVLCTKYITNDLVRTVQRALMAKGYNVGPSRADNIMGSDTRAALIKYQKDNSLPVGGLNKETLKHLGIPASYWNK